MDTLHRNPAREVIDLEFRRRRRPQRGTSYCFGFGERLARQGLAPEQQLAALVDLDDASWGRIWHDLREHVDRERAA